MPINSSYDLRHAVHVIEHPVKRSRLTISLETYKFRFKNASQSGSVETLEFDALIGAIEWVVSVVQT